MALTKQEESTAMHVEREETGNLRTALPSRPMSSKVNESSLRAPSPPPEGNQQSNSPSPRNPRQYNRSPSVLDGQPSHPISPAPSANEPVPSDGMTEPPAQVTGLLAPQSAQSGQICR